MAETREDRSHYHLLVRAGRLFNEVLDLTALLGAVRAFVQEAVGADSVSVFWLEKGGTTARALLLDNHPHPDAPSTAEALARPVVRKVVTDRVGVCVGDLDGATSGDGGDGASTAGHTAVVPLIRGGDMRGVLEVVRGPEGDPFGAGDLEFLRAVGEDIVLSLSNAFLYAKLRRLSQENELLYQISVDLGRVTDLGNLLERILDHLAEIVPYDAAGIYLRRGSTRDIQWLVYRGYGVDTDETLYLKLGEGIVGRVCQTGRPIVVDDVSVHPLYVDARPQTTSEMVVPILSAADEEVIGAFNLESDRRGAFSRRDLERLQAFAGLATVAIEREWARTLLEEKTRLDREIQVAQKIQAYFQPRSMPIIPGYDLWGDQITSIEMGGDYFDVLRVNDQNYGLVMADVSGKGIPAALIMASVRAGLISEVRNVFSIERIIQELNRFLVDSIEEMAFVTAFYGVLNTEENALTFVNAGHDPPLLFRAGEPPRWLYTGGTVLGAFPDADFVSDRVEFLPGDILVLYTDGITEARRGADDFFETERLFEAVEQTGATSAKAVGEAILEAVRRFRGDDAPTDDQTLLVVRRP